MSAIRRMRPALNRIEVLSRADQEHIGDQFLAGTPLETLAAEHRLQLHEVTEILDGLGVEWRITSSLDHEERERRETAVVARYREGGSAATVGAEFDMTARQVLALLGRRGEPRRPRHLRTVAQQQTDEAIAAVVAGEPLREASHQFGINPSKLAALLIQRWQQEDQQAARTPDGTVGDPLPEPSPLVRSLAERYLGGATVSSLAQEFDLSSPTRVSGLLIRFAEYRLAIVDARRTRQP